MPKIINAYSQDDSLTKMLGELSKSFMANTPATEYARQKAIGEMRTNENLPLVADALARGDVNSAVRYGVLSGMKGGDAASYNLLGTSGRVGDVHDPALSKAFVGAGNSYSSSPMGVDQSEANRVNIENLRTDRMAAAERYKADTMLEPVLTPEGPRYMPRSQAAGQQPVLTEGQFKGMVGQQDLPNMTPAQREAVGGYAPKNPANLWTFQKPDGSFGATADGVHDVLTGEVRPQGPLKKMEGPNTEGLSDSMEAKVVDARIKHRQAVAAIDNTIAELQKPDAGAAVGVLGTGARLFNDLRAQTEAAVRLVGGSDASAELANPDVQHTAASIADTLFGNPNFNARAQQLGINNAVLRARITDMAYTIAKEQNPNGSISKADVMNAGKVVGDTLMDPQAGVAVLTSYKNKLIQNHDIREQELRNMFPNLRVWQGPAAAQMPQTTAPAPNLGGAQPTPAAPAAAPRPRATNPQTGQAVEFDGQQWVPVQ